MVRNPVARDVDAAANPYPIVIEHIIEESRQPLRAPGPPDQAIMQRKRHHPRLALALAIKHVEGILHVGEEVLRGRKSHIAVEPVVVALVGIGDDEVRAAADVVG